MSMEWSKSENILKVIRGIGDSEMRTIEMPNKAYYDKSKVKRLEDLGMGIRDGFRPFTVGYTAAVAQLGNRMAAMVVLPDSGNDNGYCDQQTAQELHRQGLVVAIRKLPRPVVIKGVGDCPKVVFCIIIFLNFGCGPEAIQLEIAKMNGATLLGKKILVPFGASLDTAEDQISFKKRGHSLFQKIRRSFLWIQKLSARCGRRNSTLINAARPESELRR